MICNYQSNICSFAGRKWQFKLNIGNRISPEQHAFWSKFVKTSTYIVHLFHFKFCDINLFLIQGCRLGSLPDIDDFFWEKVPTPILDVVENPIHLKNLSIKVYKMDWDSLRLYITFKLKTLFLYLQELKQLAEEIRLELSSIMSKTKKSFKSSLSVVELTIAIHHVFHTPVDKILWDEGEQVR